MITVPEEEGPCVKILAGNSEDILKNRLNELKHLARSCLFENKEISTKYLGTKLSNITTQGADVVIIIVTFMKRYIQPKEHHHNVAYQIPFSLMANELLKAVSYEKHMSKPIPSIKIHSLYSLFIDTATPPSLLQMSITALKLVFIVIANLLNQESGKMVV